MSDNSISMALTVWNFNGYRFVIGDNGDGGAVEVKYFEDECPVPKSKMTLGGLDDAEAVAKALLQYVEFERSQKR